MTLAPLTAAEVGRQLEAIAGRPSPTPSPSALHARAGGNPFFVEELVRGGADGESCPTRSPRRCWRASSGSTRPARSSSASSPRPAGASTTTCSSGSRGTSSSGRAARRARRPHPRARAGRPRRGVSPRAARRGRLRPPASAGAPPDAPRHRGGAGGAPDASPAQLAHQWHRAGEPAAALRASVAAGLEASRLYAFAEARVAPRARARAVGCRAPAADSLPVDRVELLARAAQAARFAGDPRTRDHALRGGAGPARPCRGARPRVAPLRAPGRVPLLGRRDRARLLPPGAAAAARRRRAGAGAAAGRGRARVDGPPPLGGVARVLRGGARGGGAVGDPARRSARAPRSGSCSASWASPRRASGTSATRSRPRRRSGRARTPCAPTSCSASCCACAETTPGRWP